MYALAVKGDDVKPKGIPNKLTFDERIQGYYSRKSPGWICPLRGTISLGRL